jgi:hypothetical protein
MGAASRRKGADGERELIALARACGLEAERTWSTAQHPDPAERRCDVRVEGRPCQVKRQRDGFKALYDGLEAVEFLFVRTDGESWLAIIRSEELFELLKENGRRSCNP